MADLEIPLPPLSVQKQIVAELSGYQKQIEGARGKIAKTEEKIKSKIESI